MPDFNYHNPVGITDKALTGDGLIALCVAYLTNALFHIQGAGIGIVFLYAAIDIYRAKRQIALTELTGELHRQGFGGFTIFAFAN